MKYLKKFENIEENSFREITRDEYYSAEWLKFENSEIKELKSLFSKKGIELVYDHEDLFELVKIELHQLKKSIYVRKIKDNYYAVNFDYLKYYLCDDTYGVSKLLDYIKNINN